MGETLSHQSVLLTEAIDALAIRPDGIYLDGTFGRGGHAAEILKKLNDQGRLLAMDQDPQAVEIAEKRFAGDQRFEIVHANFESLSDVVCKKGLDQKVDGILLDIGVSSPQLDDAARGFSFMKSGPLDMRMNPAIGQSAAQWLASVEEKELTDVLRRLGEERFAKRIAHAIIEIRQQQPIDDTLQLAKIISDAVPKKEKHKHPATRSFQAIRIYINRELEVLEKALEDAVNVLALNGRLVVISFHSLEDRIVKRFMRDKSRGPQIPKDLPVMDSDIQVPFKVVGKMIKPGEDEIKENPRARSSVLRVLERVH
ncbi:MAG: 16S rRNA (cytosine(1402)-N(4))-methyltransferase RsmH [Gammaproteobacteria bacterium]|nr:16S rRNA (cytosine(1402)-N(4))-methyltransferase RsmH [Gammaproteobacteria bacterium]MCW8910559.1 16S rRNA (cytosine(1402)-N(4))-methyltransferase RsmH [Gammaproteobacteria bacterium]MCW9005403.1 16S rRNA (cytosine(1402)-N(4))-methyltransferase RsmH [Gammaproteobacteria bacterium]MCW9055241.1 16S rRNA (cytosine(1402)-N(4))-methyltransferase RsmH [Gammaproteobacteria bacterium]